MRRTAGQHVAQRDGDPDALDGPREIILRIFWSFWARFGLAGAFSDMHGFWIVLGFFLGRFGVLPGPAAVVFGRPFCHILGIFWGRWPRSSGRPCTGAPPCQ